MIARLELNSLAEIMQLQMTFEGPAIDDWTILNDVSPPLAKLLRQVNGFVQFHGGLHVRGACASPDWHSLRGAWRGPDAFHSAYQSLLSTDVPFAEDCVGDQFVLRGDVVWKLSAETDEVESLDVSLREFLTCAQRDPLEYLGMHPLVQYMREQGCGLAPGKLLSVYPPFCSTEAANGVHLTAISALERRRYLSEFAAAVRQVPEGGKIVIETGS